MANPGQPTISLGATGDVVKRLERALRRTPDHSVSIDGVFGPQLEAAVKLFQEGQLTADGIVGPETWAALPDGGPMPTLQVGSTGAVVREILTVPSRPMLHQRRVDRPRHALLRSGCGPLQHVSGQSTAY